MKPPRWTVVSPSAYEWEREALEFLREHLPDHEPWRAWSNFEFVDDEGRVNEVDLLVLTPAGLLLVEIKSRPGTIDGDAHGWVWTTDGRRHTVDNPLLLANRKAKRLASLLNRQDAFGRGANRAPWVTEVIFLSKVLQPPRIDPGTARRVFLRGNPRGVSDAGIIAALTGTLDPELGRPGSVDSNIARATARSIEQAGIRPAGRDRRVGDYLLGALLGEGDGWQDFLAKHASLGVARRVRVYPYARAASPDERERLGRMAMREFRVLEGIDHPGILRVLDFRETELGPALVFEHRSELDPVRSFPAREAVQPDRRCASGVAPAACRGAWPRARQAALSSWPRPAECARSWCRGRAASAADHELAGCFPRRGKPERQSDHLRHAPYRRSLWRSGQSLPRAGGAQRWRGRSTGRCLFVGGHRLPSIHRSPASGQSVGSACEVARGRWAAACASGRWHRHIHRGPGPRVNRPGCEGPYRVGWGVPRISRLGRNRRACAGFRNDRRPQHREAR